MKFVTSADIRNNSFGIWKNAKDNQSATFTPLGSAVFVESITSCIENNDIQLLLSFDYGGETRYLTINRGELGDLKLIQKLASKGADITKRHFDIFVDTLRQQEYEIFQSGKLVKYVFFNLGWINVPIWNDEGQISSHQLCYRANRLIGGIKAFYRGNYWIRPSGTFAGWCELVKAEVLGNIPLEIILLAGLSAVVNGLIAPYTTQENPIFHLCGNSGTGKSTALKLCASISGRPFDGNQPDIKNTGEVVLRSSIYKNWSLTESAITRQCVGNQGAVIILNELGKYRGKDLTPVVYDLSDGVEKGRLDSEYKVHSAENFLTTIVSSGEVSLLDQCKSRLEGLQTRVMEITDPLTTDAAHASRIQKGYNEHYGHAAPALAKHIIDSGGVDYVLPIYEDYCHNLQDTLPHTPSSTRFIEKFPALLLTTAKIANNALGLSFSIDEIIKYFINYEKTAGMKRNVSQTSYHVLIEACRTQKTCFYIDEEPTPKVKSHGRISYPNEILSDGRCVVEQYEIRRDFVEEILKKNHFHNLAKCAKEWRSMGVLDCEDGHLTRSRIIDRSSTKKERVFVLRVFGDVSVTPQKAKSQLIKATSTSKLAPSSQRASLLCDDDEADEGKEVV